MSLLTTYSVSSGDNIAKSERCEEEEDQTPQAGKDQTACMAEADSTSLMDQEDEPAWLEEEDQTDMGEHGEGPQTAEEGQNSMAEQEQTALVNKDFSLGQAISGDKDKCQEGMLDKEEDGNGRGHQPTEEEDKEAEDGKGRGDQPMEEDGKGKGDQPAEEEDKEAEDEPEELLDGRTPSRSASLTRLFSRPPNQTASATEHL